MNLRFKIVLPVLTLLLSGCDGKQMNTIDFKKMQANPKPNSYLVCPKDFCNLTPNAYAPTYPVNVSALKTAWEIILSKQPRVHLVSTIPSQHQYQYVQYSWFFHFPDYIDIQFIPLNEYSSTLAIYSRAKYGYYDFHVNQNRVKQWLKLLSEAVSGH